MAVLKERKIYVRCIALLLYTWSSIRLMTTSFHGVDAIAQAAVWMTASLVVLTLLAIEYQDTYFHTLGKFVAWGLLTQLLIWTVYFFIGSGGGQIAPHIFLFKIISLCVLHGGIAYVLWVKHHFLRYRAMFGLGILLTTGVPMYMISLALAVAFGIGASFRPVGIDCTVMTHGISTFLSNVLPRRKNSVPATQTGSLVAQQATTGNDVELLRGAFTQRVSQYKTMMIDDLLQQKSFLDERVCGAIVEQLRTLADIPGVRLSVVLLLFLLLWPLLTLYGRFVSGIGILLFYILIRLGVYTWASRHVLGRTIK